MKGSPPPAWLKYLPIVFGWLLILGSLGYSPFVGKKVWAAWESRAQISKQPQDRQTEFIAMLAGEATGTLVLLFVGIWLVRKSSRKSRQDAESGPMPVAAPATSHAAVRRQAGKRWSACNVLMPGTQIRELWQFNASGNKFNLARTESKLPSEPLPVKLVGKDWSTVFQPRLNIAWLPAEKVFLRVVQLPKVDPAETQSMLEFQLEKLSPMPPNQVVWSYEIFPYIARGGASDHLNPHAAGEQQTVVVIMAARNHVEEFLGQLEAQGYVADRLELPLLDKLRSTQVRENGAWVFPSIGGHPGVCMVAWWYEGVLQSLTLLNLPAGEARVPAFREQLAQAIWAGEMEGWLTSNPRFHLVADEETAAAWLPNFDPNVTVEVLPPPPAQALAAMTARRVATTAATTNLLPPEFTKRYRQQFVDRLWMQSLGAVLLCYIFCVVIYIGFVTLADYRLDSTQTEARGLSIQYTNTLQLKEKLRVLQETLELQYAGLECYKAVADTMPAELTLDSLRFAGGREVTYTGSAGDVSDRSKIFEFIEALGKVEYNGQPLFSKVNIGRVDNKAGGAGLTWSLVCALKRTDTTE